MSDTPNRGQVPTPLSPALAGTVVEEKRDRAMRLLAPKINDELGKPCESYQYNIDFTLWHLGCGDGNEVDMTDLELVATVYRTAGWDCAAGNSQRDGMWITFQKPK